MTDIENRDENDDIRSPILGSTSFWNIPFDQEIVRVTNQITSFEQDIQIPEEITRKLIIVRLHILNELIHELIYCKISYPSYGLMKWYVNCFYRVFKTKINI